MESCSNKKSFKQIIVYVTTSAKVDASPCSVCAQCKTTRHLPRGKLHPLPVPQRPWSHLSIDFLTDLPHHRETPRSWLLWIISLCPAVSFLCPVSLRPYRLQMPCLRTSSGTTGCLRILYLIGVPSSRLGSGRRSWNVWGFRSALLQGFTPRVMGW